MSKREYEPITLERQAEYVARFQACPQKASDYSFVNLWGWAEEYGLEWAWEDGVVWIRQTHPQTMCWAPVGDWAKIDWEALFPSLSEGHKFIRVPETLVEVWRERLDGRIQAEEARGHWDYLYAIEDLVTLRGNKFHKKKNLLAQFKKGYIWDYRCITADCVEETLRMQQEWCDWRECTGAGALVAENTAIKRVLTEWDRIPGLLGGAIHVDGKIVAYTVAEVLSNDTLVIHFEKGQPGYKGVYQAINQMFLEASGNGFSRVNREQDLDDEGLRKAKLSYNPNDFLKKFTVTVGG